MFALAFALPRGGHISCYHSLHLEAEKRLQLEEAFRKRNTRCFTMA